MWIIDRYVLRQFFQVFLICFTSLVGLYIIFDAFANLDGFLQYANRQGGLVKIVSGYYALRSLLFFDRTVGWLTLIAAMFTVTWLQRHNEMTALLAAGISRVRIITPLVAAVVAIIGLAAVSRETVIPRFRMEMARTPQDLAGEAPHSVRSQVDDNDVSIEGESLYTDPKRIEGAKISLPHPLRHYCKQGLRARTAYYQAAEADRPGGFLLDGIEQPKDLASQPSLVRNGKPILVTPRDASWLKPGQCFFVTNVAFEQLIDEQAWLEFSSTAQLIHEVKTSNLYEGKYRVAIHGRFVQPLLDITLLFLGLPLVLARGSRNVFLAMGLCVVVGAVFEIVVMAFHFLGSRGAMITPALAAWAPLAIFVPLAVEMAQGIRK
jgi:lipopolysaccharide export system permease protein